MREGWIINVLKTSLAYKVNCYPMETLRMYPFKAMRLTTTFRSSNEQSQSHVIPVERFRASRRQTDKPNEHISAQKQAAFT